MDYVFQTIDRCDLALAALVAASCDDNFVVFADGNGANLWGKDFVSSTFRLNLVLYIRGMVNRTLCCSRSSLLKAALINTLRTLEGAVKYALRCLLLEEVTAEKVHVS